MSKGNGTCSNRNVLQINASNNIKYIENSTNWNIENHKKLINEINNKFSDEITRKIGYVIADERRRTKFYLIKDKIKELEENHNIFLAMASSPEFMIASKQSRSLTSRLGFELERISQKIIPLDNNKTICRCIAFDNNKYPIKEDKSLIYTNSNKDLVKNEADRLTNFISNSKNNKIGNKSFKIELNKSLEIIKNSKQNEIWMQETDIIYRHNGIYNLIELKSGGELDSSNTPKQITKLLKSVLILGHTNSNFLLCCTYSNKGEGKTIKGGLPQYFDSINKPDSQLLTGKTYWEKILPYQTSYKEFVELFQICSNYYKAHSGD